MKSRSEARREYELDQTFFDVIDTEERAYFLGLLYADGYNNEQRGEIHLSLQEEDRHILDEFRRAVKSSRPLLFIDLSKRNEGKQKDVYRFDISSHKISMRLKELGCMQAKSMILRFPTSDQIPDHLIHHFIRGAFDGDGCFVTTNTGGDYQQWSATIVSTEDFCHGLQRVAQEKVGISTYLSKRHKDRNDTNRNFHVSGNKQVKKFMDWLYSDAKIYFNRKHNKYQKAVKALTA